MPRCNKTDIAEKYLFATPPASRAAALPRILQFTSEDQFTKYEICQLLAEIMGLPLTAAMMEPNAQGNDPAAAVQRPYDTHLSTRALRDLGISVATMDFAGWWRWHVRAFRK